MSDTTDDMEAYADDAAEYFENKHKTKYKKTSIMSESKIGTLETYRPLMVKEDHKTWKSSYGKQMWDFIGTIDGVDGIFSSTSNEPHWTAGQKVSYTSDHKEGNKYPKFKIKKLDEDTGQPKEYKDNYNDMESIRQQAEGTARELALKTFVELGKTDVDGGAIDKVTIFYYDWLVDSVQKRDVFYSRQKGLSSAIECIKFPKFGLKIAKPWKEIMALAQENFDKSSKVRQTTEENYS